MPKSLLLFLITITLSAAASAKRYVIILDGDSHTKSVAQQLRAFSADSPLFSAKALKDAFSLNKATKPSLRVESELRNLKTLIVDSNEKDMALFKQARGVLRVEEDIIFAAPTPIGGKALKVGVQKRSGGAKLPWGISRVKAPEAWALNGKGKGIRVMVLDTGVDKNHPDLKKNFEKGRSFVGQDASLPYDFFDVVGHGTHVAGTILGSGDSEVLGVAPSASLLAGRICAAEGCSTAAIYAGVEWAVEEKADVVNMSLGGAYPMPSSDLYDRATKQGVAIIAAAGNRGTSSVDYPAAFESTIAVGAIDQSENRAQFSQYGHLLDLVAPGVGVRSSVPQGTGRFSRVTAQPLGADPTESTPLVGAAIDEVRGELEYAGIGLPDDFTNLDLRGKIALIKRGQINFLNKVQGAVNAGAIGVIIFNNEPGLINGMLSPDGSQVANVPAAMITQAQGEALAADLSAGKRVRGSVGIVPGDYAEMQGTSMATPHVAGVVALILAANGNLDVEQIRTILKNNARDLGNQMITGAGLVNAEASVRDALGRAFLID